MAEYSKELNYKLNTKLKAVSDSLPKFSKVYFRGISNNTSIKTRIAYAQDLKIFFEYLLEEHEDFKDYDDISQISLTKFW